MTCEETRTLLHGYLDDELDLVSSLEIERHLTGCPTCAAVLSNQRVVRTALADAALYHPAPAGLEERIRAGLRPAARRRLAFPVFSWRWAALAASVALAALLTWDVWRGSSGPSADLVARQVASDHVRSLLGPDDYLMTRKSSNQHIIKPWLSRQVGFSPVVKDLTDQGFPLLGARIDYVGGSRAAVLVYGRHRHRINLFAWPAGTETDGPVEGMTLEGIHLLSWTAGGLQYWAVSDLNEQELREFVALIRR
jgi:anti-sigma factor RsiW